MVYVKPFHGYIYNPEQFEELTPVVSPPYDVISPMMREKYLGNSNYNVVNLILGKIDQHGKIEETFYPDAKTKWNQWITTGILKRLTKPAVWKIKETFLSLEGKSLTREGFIALIRLENYSPKGVIPHEKTHVGPKEDRFKLMTATHANFSPIFFVFQDSGETARQLYKSFQPEFTTKAQLNYEDTVKIEASYTTDTDWIQSFITLMKELPVLIADGHHRYETALNFHASQKPSSTLNTAEIMGYFVPSNSPGLIITSTHRGIHSLPDFNEENFYHLCLIDFEIEKKDAYRMKDEGGVPPTIWGVTRNQEIWTLNLKKDSLRDLKKKLIPSSLTSLDVVIFEEIICKKILGLSQHDISHQTCLKYYHRKEDCHEALKNGEIQMAFLLSPLPVKKIFDIASEGGVLPQKTTFFYPKCPVGIVMHSFELLKETS